MQSLKRSGKQAIRTVLGNSMKKYPIRTNYICFTELQVLCHIAVTGVEF